MPRSKDGGTSGEESSSSSPRSVASTTSSKHKHKRKPKSASSSSDFEFTVTLSPTSALSSSACPADELFYKGQLLPLHLPPRISMVRSLLLSSSSTSSATTTSTSRDSNGSTSSSFSADLRHSDSAPSSSRPSSVTDEEVPLPPHISLRQLPPKPQRSNKYLSSLATRFSSVFLPRGNSKKDTQAPIASNTKVKPSTKEVLKKYVKKVKPFYEKLSYLPQKQNLNLNLNQTQNQIQNPPQKKNFSFSIRKETTSKLENKIQEEKRDNIFDHPHHHSKSFSGNLKYPRRKRCAASCPSSMNSSPSHSGLLCIGGGGPGAFPTSGPVSISSAASSMEELQSAIEGAIAHCKSSLGGTKKVFCTRSMEFDSEIVLDH